MNRKLLMVSLVCFMLSNIPNCTGATVALCEERIRDFFCGWEPEEPKCPSGYGCWLIHATGEKVCCPEVEIGWRRKRRTSRRNENKKDNGKTEFRHVIEYN